MMMGALDIRIVVPSYTTTLALQTPPHLSLNPKNPASPNEDLYWLQDIDEEVERAATLLF